MTTNKDRLEKSLKEKGFKIGTYSMLMESVSRHYLSKIKDKMIYGSGDVKVRIDRIPFVIEIFHVDNEIDFVVTSKKDYIKKFGIEQYEGIES